MNKYQEFAIRKVGVVAQNKGDDCLKDLTWDFEEIKVSQNENYNLTKYGIVVRGWSIKAIKYKVNNKIRNAEKLNQLDFLIELDFDDKIKNITIYFDKNMIDPVEIKVSYIDADRKKWDEKMKKLHREELNKKANIKVKTGDSLINVIFNPISEKYAYSKVELYLDSKELQFMARYKIEGEVFFHSINGLAYGSYAFVLIQYDKDNNEIYKSDYISVSLNKPIYSNKSVVPWY